MRFLSTGDEPLRILLVEDNPGDAQLVELRLAEVLPSDYELCHVERLSDAVEVLEAGEADVGLLDLGLPDASGLETVRRARAAADGIPLVVLTGLDDESVALEVLREGAQDYLVKDRIDPETLERSLRYSLERARATRDLERTERRLERVLETIVDGILIVDPDATVRFANEGAERILGVPADELRGRKVDDPSLSGGRWRRLGPEGEPREREELAFRRALAAGEGVAGIEHVLERAGGESRVVSVNAAPLRDPAGETEGAVISLRDVTRQRAFEQKLEEQALYDGLTGLPNRALFFDRLEQAAARADRDRGGFAVLFIDLDRFKDVNDSLGHAAGDRVLERVADRIAGCFRQEDTVARIGGDEFTVLLEGVGDREEVRELLGRLRTSLEPPHRVHGQQFRVPASVGVVMAEGQIDPDRIVRRADAAMYRIKERGGGGHHFLAPDEEAEETRRLQREARLRQGIRAREFTLHYQPVVELATGEAVAVEALARWRHPERGLREPEEFIDLAEETGLIVPLGMDLLRAACRELAGEATDPPLRLAVNLSPRQFEASGLIPGVAELLAETGFPARRLTFEVTERMMMRTTDRVDALRELGVALAIDDFGTGYSSLAYLRELPVDQLKIDRAFTAGLGRASGDEALVRTILTLGGELGLEVVAEGIERPEQVDRLRELGCRRAQGFLIARPMPAHELEAWLEDRGSRQGRGPTG